ncbi:MAG: hypothetical protein J7578_22770 [Chitinophagaceae bacterium]|nr:hypothetical protein [Chitinophagaceae bacterium]
MQIGNFTIQQENGKTTINYHRSLKDWFDIILFLVPGIAAFTFIVIMYRHTRFSDWIYWVIAGVLGFYALIKLAEGLSRLIRPVRSIVVINQHDLTSRYSGFRKTVIPLHEISQIQLRGTKEEMAGKATRTSTYCKIEVLDKQGKATPIILINTKKLFRLSNKKTSADVYDVGQELAKFLAEKTHVTYRWMGFQTGYK